MAKLIPLPTSIKSDTFHIFGLMKMTWATVELGQLI